MSNGGWKAGELADTLRNGDFEADIDAVLSDHDMSGDVLSRAELAGIQDGPLADLLRRETSTEMLRRARQNSDVASMSAATGLSKRSIDISDWRQIQAIQDLFRKKPRVRKDLTNAVFQCVLFSSCIPPTGRGKTSTAYWLIENAEIVDPDITVLTNNPSDEYPNVPEQWEDLKTEIRDAKGWSIILLDEAAQFLQYADQGAGKAVSQLMKLLRHNKCHLIMVGHTGMDVPADIRRQMYFIDKQSKKKAVLGYGLTGRSGDNRMQVSDEILKMTGVPHTTVDYESQGEEAIQIRFDEDDREDTKQQDRDRIKCRGTKADGDGCSRVTDHISGLCPFHRDQWDEFDNNQDPRHKES